VPATAAGVDAIHQLVAAGRNVNVTLIFGLERYAAVHEAYISGLEARDGDLSGITSVASFFVSRVDTEVDRRLEAIDTPEALALRGKAAVAQAQIAYEMFRRELSSPRWDKLVERGARPQRPLWASTGVKNESYPDLLYVENLIGPDTVSTMPEKTIAAFLDHGRIGRTVDHDVGEAHHVMTQLAEVGVDMENVALTLEREGIAKFQDSYDHLLKTIDEKAHALT
jgi:transaldolase